MRILNLVELLLFVNELHFNKTCPERAEVSTTALA